MSYFKLFLKVFVGYILVVGLTVTIFATVISGTFPPNFVKIKKMYQNFRTNLDVATSTIPTGINLSALNDEALIETLQKRRERAPASEKHNNDTTEESPHPNPTSSLESQLLVQKIELDVLKKEYKSLRAELNQLKAEIKK
jgi:hypothetical protein